MTQVPRIDSSNGQTLDLSGLGLLKLPTNVTGPALGPYVQTSPAGPQTATPNVSGPVTSGAGYDTGNGALVPGNSTSLRGILDQVLGINRLPDNSRMANVDVNGSLATLGDIIARNLVAQAGATISGNITCGGELGTVATFNVVNYGATGNGIANDAPFIQAAITACVAAGYGKGRLYFPPLKYNYQSASPMELGGIAFVDGAGATIDGVGATTTDCFWITNPNGITPRYNLPVISNFRNGTAIKMRATGGLGCNTVVGTCAEVAFCKVALEYYCPTSQILDTTWDIPFISGGFGTVTNPIGIQFDCSNAADTMQGNIVRCNFITGCFLAVYFHNTSGGSVHNPCNFNYLAISNIDPGQVGSPCSIITWDANMTNDGPNYVRCESFCGGSGTDISGGGMFQQGANCTIRGFLLEALYTAGGGSPVYPLANIAGAGNVVRAPAGAWASGGNYNVLAASLTANARGTFNGGAPWLTNRLRLSFTNSGGGLTAGQTLDFYVYSPFLNGLTLCRFDMTDASGAPIAFVSAADVSVIADSGGVTHPNEIHLRFIALGTVPINSNWFGTLELA